MANQQSSLVTTLRSAFVVIVIILAGISGFLIFKLVLGNGSHFKLGDNHNEPIDFLGRMYTGGPIVPILIATAIVMLTVSIERIISIILATGRGNMSSFVSKIKGHLESGNVAAAKAECNRQKGSVGNVVLAGLIKYENMENEPTLNRDQKVLAIQKELEEATSLELPGLERNLVILSTIASVAVLLGLFGTVLGMIRAFGALATQGAPDAAALANGISEALFNTALGIGTSTLAIIFYNTFTTIIDRITYNIDESGFIISQTFASRNK